MVLELPQTPSRRAVLGTGASVVAGGILSGALATNADAQSSALASAPDWPLERYDPAGTGYNPDVDGPGTSVREAWRTDLDDFRGGDASPILVDGTLYVVGGGVAALDAADGSVTYHYDGQHRRTPALAPAEAYTSDTLVVAGERGYTGLHVDGGVELFGRRVGLERWRHRAAGDRFSFFSAPSAPAPVVSDGTVYVANPTTDRLAAIDPSNGREQWGHEVSDEGVGGQPGRPAVLDGTVYVTHWPHNVTAYDAATGAHLWDADVTEQFVLPPTATSESVLVPDRTGVTALDPDEGSELWRYEHDGNATAGAAAVAEGTVYLTAGYSNPTLHAVDLATGEAVWETPNVAQESVPVVADGVVYVSARVTDELVAVDAATGEVHWRFDTEYGVGIPAVSDGKLFLTGGYGHVYALEAGR